MKLHVINTGNFKLDGGAMFGVVPKSLWSRTNQPDKNNLCTWAMRSLLIEQGDRLILIDTGIGNKQNEKLHHNKKSVMNFLFFETSLYWSILHTSGVINACAVSFSFHYSSRQA